MIVCHTDSPPGWRSYCGVGNEKKAWGCRPRLCKSVTEIPILSSGPDWSRSTPTSRRENTTFRDRRHGNRHTRCTIALAEDDLQMVIDAWAGLSEATKVGILAMVRAAGENNE